MIKKSRLEENKVAKSKGRKSRRETPWDEAAELTATQMFLKEQYKMRYADRHRRVSESGEAKMINSYSPANCPFCGSKEFIKRGFTASGIQRYLCTCKKAFVPTTGTIFGEHKLSIDANQDLSCNNKNEMKNGPRCDKLG